MIRQVDSRSLPLVPSGSGQVSTLVSRHKTFFLYVLIGASGVLLDLLTFMLLYNVAGLWEGFATAVSTTLGITNNFALNAMFNFRVRDRLLWRFARFYTVGVVGIGLTVLLFIVFSDWLGVDANIVKVLSLPPVLVLQFLLNSRWSFR